MQESFKPELDDLYRLYQFIKLNNRTTILEFGSGWSSLLFALALSELKKEKFSKTKNLRRNNLFDLFVVENQKKIYRKKIFYFYIKSAFSFFKCENDKLSREYCH